MDDYVFIILISIIMTLLLQLFLMIMLGPQDYLSIITGIGT